MLFLLTEKCSLKCPHCMLDCDEDGTECNRQVLNAFIKFFNKSGNIFLNVSGGEPTEHPHFFEYFKIILKTVQKNRSVSLLSNGQFLFDRDFRKRLFALQHKHDFFLQISSITDLYPNNEQTMEQINKCWHLFDHPKTTFVTQLTTIENLGRAAGKDWSHLGELYQRKFPHCFNLFSAVKSGRFNDLTAVFVCLDKNLETYKCKPMVDSHGIIYPGETNICKPIGNVLDSSVQNVFDNLKADSACGKCGVIAY